MDAEVSSVMANMIRSMRCEGVASCRPPEARDLVVSVRYRTRDGSAQAGADYEKTEGMLLFEPGTETQQITLTVFEDEEVEEDEDFFVDLLDVNPPNVFLQRSTVWPVPGLHLVVWKISPCCLQIVPGWAADWKGCLLVIQHTSAWLQVRVTIVDTTEAGLLQFEDTHISVPATHKSIDAHVIRKGGCSGTMKVEYFTQSDTAVAGAVP